MSVSAVSAPRFAIGSGRVALAAREIAAWCPALAFAYPMLVWPMMFSAWRAGSGTGSSLSNVAASESNPINVVWFLALGALAALVALPRLRWGARVAWTPVLAFALLYLALAGASVAWALEAGITFRRFVLQALIVLAALVAALLEPDPRAVARRLAAVAGAAVALNLLWLGVKPPSPLGVEGIYPQKNALGVALLVALPLLVFAALDARERGRALACTVSLALMLAAFALLVLSRSKTSLGLAALVPIAAFGLVVVGRAVRVSPALVLFYGSAVVLAATTLGHALFGWTIEDASVLLFGDPTFTGRDVIWGFAAEQARARPWLGYGFNGFWGIGYASPAVSNGPLFVNSVLQSHNGYIDVRLELGWLGLGVMAALLAAGLARIGALAGADALLGWTCLCLALIAVLHNGLESSLARGFNLVWIAFLAAVCVASPRWAPPVSPSVRPERSGA